VSFGFGILAVRLGLSVTGAVAISLTNLTSAGQAAGVEIIAAAGTLLEMALTQFIINLRYALMGFSLSQKLDSRFTTPHRLLAGFGITDEIFAVAYAQPTPVTPAYMYGLIAVSWLGWVTGTALGAMAGQLLPAMVADAMGILLYGMFIAIVVPPARKEKRVLFVVLTAAVLSVAFYVGLPALPSSLAVVISAVVAASLGAWWFPLQNDEEGEG
jgi:predicted branched-subunit amino acid permease